VRVYRKRSKDFIFYVDIPEEITDAELERLVKRKTDCFKPIGVDVYFGREPKHFTA